MPLLSCGPYDHRQGEKNTDCSGHQLLSSEPPGASRLYMNGGEMRHDLIRKQRGAVRLEISCNIR